jgi:hypothetical protein
MPFSAPFMRPVTFRAPIQLRSDGRFTFACDGKAAWLVNVADDLGYFADAVAWLPDNPAEWSMLQRRIPIMGAAEVLFAAEVGCDLFLVETPGRWCEIACRGPWPGPCAVILDWDARDSLRLWLSLVRGVQCETPALARALGTVLCAAPARQRLRVELAEGV